MFPNDHKGAFKFIHDFPDLFLGQNPVEIIVDVII